MRKVFLNSKENVPNDIPISTTCSVLLCCLALAYEKVSARVSTWKSSHDYVEHLRKRSDDAETCRQTILQEQRKKEMEEYDHEEGHWNLYYLRYQPL